MNDFSELNLSGPLARALAQMEFHKPTPIQAQTLPILLGEPTDFLGMAATGTGKTAAFGIPLLHKIEPQSKDTQAVVLCPTRELANQVAGQITLMGQFMGVQAQAIYGGAGYADQIRGLKRGAPIVVATPGRLIDHLKQGNVSLSAVKTIVLDEADEMISMGFQEELEAILQHLNLENSRVWLFAATMSPPLRKVADRYLRTPKVTQVNRKEMLSGTVKQIYYTVREKNKPKGLCKVIDMADDFYGLIFCQTRALVTDLTNYLMVRGYSVDCLHGDKSQTERERTLRLFRDRNVNILVCTDVAARGLDVKDLTHVINFSLPLDLETYIHRIGRTGRSGSEGLALTLVGPREFHLVDRIEKITKSKLEAGIFPSRKDISAKKMVRLFPKFSAVEGHEKAREILDESWIQAFEKMEKLEIAGRFLALAFPELFDDREKAEELALSESTPERESGAPRRFVHGRKPHAGGPRPPWRGKPHPHRGNKKRTAGPHPKRGPAPR